MEHEERALLLLSMQEHPEQYTDEQLQQMLADDPELAELLDTLMLTKQAFVKRETDNEAIDIDEEWQKFYAKHSVGTGINDDAAPHESSVRRFRAHVPFKLAASFIGILLTVGVALAAVHFVQKASTPIKQDTQTEQPGAILSEKTVPADTIKADTTLTAQPMVFDNTPLDEMLPTIADYYNKEVEFIDDDARVLRFYFVWKPEDGLEATLHRLALFESVNIRLKGNKIVVE